MQAIQQNVIAAAIVPTRKAVVTVALVVGFALLTAATAQIRIPLPGTPVPITGQTLGVLLTGAALGSVAGTSSIVLYISLGALGLPFYAGGTSGWGHLSGGTFGYFIGFIVAAWVVGWFAEHRRDRVVRTAVPAFIVGSLVIYTFGVGWLWLTVFSDLGTAISRGMTPFLVGDTIKAVLAGLLLPGTWWLVDRSRA
ncbi:MAG: biotin transporter BioY [Acidimicrobiia bacterium]|nr:MAG: biotin transporter BioY [Acidimicrobiia bacterium]